MFERQRRTKILATLGPATGPPGVLEDLFRAGVNVVRLNFSHGDPSGQAKRAAEVRAAAARVGVEVGILADLPGPKIRIERFAEGKVQLKAGDRFDLIASENAGPGNASQVGVSYLGLPQDVGPGDVLLLDDGLMQLQVVEVQGDRIVNTVLNDGVLSDRKGLNKQGGGLSLGALTMLTGCNLTSDGAVDNALRAMSRWNDRVQAWIFDPGKLAPTYTKADITTPFPFNAFYREARAPVVDGATYRLEVSGLVQDRKSWTIEDLRALPQVSQITRHICVEGWSAIGKWTGAPLHEVLIQCAPDQSARFVVFECFDPKPGAGGRQTPYYESIDLFDAYHPQTLLAYALNDEPLSVGHGAPLRLRVERQLGYKQAKFIKRIVLASSLAGIYGGNGGYWEDVAGYEWYGGI